MEPTQTVESQVETPIVEQNVQDDVTSPETVTTPEPVVLTDTQVQPPAEDDTAPQVETPSETVSEVDEKLAKLIPNSNHRALAYLILRGGTDEQALAEGFGNIQFMEMEILLIKNGLKEGDISNVCLNC